MNALNAYNALNANVTATKKASEKLSSGYRINRAGDDAAGLAISEKMRSQLKGLNQAIRNSQDGINMIQTFEGAAQETHSILQRMKELATESANGTYDNATDRAAIQLEFDQLNDELNQIADTDFNGTIVLNGGVMADGLEATNVENGLGEFDYSNKADQAAAAKAAIEAKIAELKAAAPEDIVANDDKWGTLDDTGYQAAQAKQLWTDLGLDASKVSDVDITFTATVGTDGKPSYKATSGTALDADGNVVAELTETQLAKFVTTAKNGDANTTGMGGFTVNAGGTATVDAIFDATDLTTGDVVAIKFTGPGEAPKAPTNIGFANDSFEFTNTDTDETKYSVSLDAGLNDAAMTEEIKDVLDVLNGSEWELTIANGANAPANAGGVKVDNQIASGTGKITVDGVDFHVDVTTTAGKITISTWDTDNNAVGIALAEIDLTASANATAAGSTKFTLNLDTYGYADPAGVDAEPIEGTPNTAAIDAQIADLEAQLTDTGVTKADAFDNSTARMTYAENITLQTGARTKDSVNFSFKYNTDGSADMGDLKANLNLSAREDGLATANLTLSNQDDANYAIDQIDKAINKTSMVRATFGAIQNRLEHKITNLTTTSENLQEAESAIRDTDMASEMMNYTKYNILQQAAQSMLAQANQQPQSILQLLG